MVPVIHGSGDFAWDVRQLMLDRKFDCLAVPLPESFRESVEIAIKQLPTPSIVIQQDFLDYASRLGEAAESFSADGYSADGYSADEFSSNEFSGTDYSGEEDFSSSDSDSETFDPEAFDPEALGDDEPDEDDAENNASYVPIDPCQPVIAAIRTAMGERIPRAYIDQETSSFESHGQIMPDAFALKRVSLDKFVASILPTIPRPREPQRLQRIATMAGQLKELCTRYESILFVCNILDWPWIKEEFDKRDVTVAENESVNEAAHYGVDNETLYFLLGELPFITGLYERARAELESDQFLSIDGIKSLLLSARDSYQSELKGRARKITPHLLATCLKYLRNLTLLDQRFTPDLPDIVLASQQVFGDQFALQVFQQAKHYPYSDAEAHEKVRMGIEQGALPDGTVLQLTSRLPGVPLNWRSLSIKKKPEAEDIKKWQQRWNPFQQCSWPPEDELIENFRQTVLDRAQQVLGADLARTEKFTSSIKDGIDIRDTLRHWYEGEIYVKVLPPNRGEMDCAVMLFDSPADPREYPWRTTWFAEHENESTLAFFATNFADNPVGPGICLANYGGAMFLFPPRHITDVWNDQRLDFTGTLEERLLAAACLHSQSKAIALLAPAPPGAGWRRLAKKYGKTLVHLPMGQFSASTIAQLRYVHVLNGQQVRSYADSFIRKA